MRLGSQLAGRTVQKQEVNRAGKGPGSIKGWETLNENSLELYGWTLISGRLCHHFCLSIPGTPSFPDFPAIQIWADLCYVSSSATWLMYHPHNTSLVTVPPFPQRLIQHTHTQESSSTVTQASLTVSTLLPWPRRHPKWQLIFSGFANLMGWNCGTVRQAAFSQRIPSVPYKWLSLLSQVTFALHAWLAH